MSAVQVEQVGRREGRPRRRGRMLAVTGLVSMALIAAACGDDGDDGNDDASPGATAETTAGEDGGGDAGSSDILTTLFAADGESPLAGETITIGASLTLSGTTASFGQDGLNGLELAVRHIEEAGGPTFELVVEDVQFDPTKGVAAARRFANEDLGVQATAASAVLGSQIPVIEQEQLLTFDPSAGVGTLPSMPFFWAGKGETPNGPWAGTIEYLTQEMPDVETAMLVGAGGGSAIDDTQEQQLEDALDGSGIEYLGAERYPQGQNTDFSNVIQRANGREPDVIFLAAYAADPGNFMKQYEAAGGDAQVIVPEYTREGAEAGGSAYDDVLFAQDNFLPTAPSNEWAEFFTQEYEAEYDSAPTIYAASYYDTLFLIWKLIELNDGDASSGEALQNVLMDNLGPWPSVVGTGEESGTIEFDPETHAMSERGYVLGDVVDGEPVPLAYFGPDGGDFELAE